MGAAGWLIRVRLRSRWTAFVPIAVVAMLGGVGTFVAAGAADRTASAYSRYLDRAEVSDVVINPSLFSRDIDRVIRTLPGVTQVTRSALFNVVGASPFGPRAEPDDALNATEVIGSTDGRFTAMDRPTLVKGRSANGHHEAVVDVELADHEHVHLGDMLPLSFGSRLDDVQNPNKPARSIGTERVRVVGIATLSDEVLPDGVFPRFRVIVSPDVARRYDCLPEAPGAGAATAEWLARLAPADCGVSYQYYSLKIRGGDRGVTAALDAFTKQSDTLNAELPQALRDSGAAYTLVAKTTTHAERQRVERSITPVVIALLVLAVAAAAITTAILGLVIARELGRVRIHQLEWWHLGLTRRARFGVIVVPLLVAVGGGLVVAVLLAWLLSPVAPLGTVRTVDPFPARVISSWVGLAIVVLVLAFGTLIALLVTRATRSLTSNAGTVSKRIVRGVLRTPNRPAVDEGLRAAYGRSRGNPLVVALAAGAVAVFLAAVVFGASLSTVTSTPASYGWPWDIAVMGNFGYGGLNAKAVATTLDRAANVQGWSALGFSNSITLDHDAVPAVFVFDHASAANLTVVAGRLPSARDEIALGALTAAGHHAGVGDKLNIAGYEIAPGRATVTGIVVLPALGQLQADRPAPGRGVLIPGTMVKASVTKGPLSPVSFVGIQLRSGVDPDVALNSLRHASDSWNQAGSPLLRYSKPVRPAEIINARSIRIGPLLVGGLLAIAAMIGLAVGVIISVRARLRDMAVLRTLGFTGRQLRVSVTAQAFATMLAGFVVGAPLGIVVGRAAWHAFASQLGVATGASLPAVGIVATGVGAALVALLAAAGPARTAVRTNPSALLRIE